MAIALGCITLGAQADPITPSEALARLGGESLRVAGIKGKSAPRLAHTAKTRTGNPAVYVFNRGEDGGYIVLSADDLAYPLLGYADTGAFSEENMPPQMRWWFDEYARQIEYATGKKQSPLASSLRNLSRAPREAIAPQLKTKWDQGAPYNNMAPTYGTERTFTGCVATSMAQVMNYWQYPEVGQGSISYNSESLGKRLTLNFANRKFDWANMADTYLPGQYTQAEADAVAYLMKAAGFSVKMDYAADSSGALAMNISNALVKYFKYDGNINYALRLYYTCSEWEQMIYDNLKNVGPILYGGGSMLGGGHSFVCDGYDGNGFFHFNWGWSGMSDGYFSLDALNPGSLGTGGGSGGGYNFTQDAVLNVQPPTGKPVETHTPVMTQMGSLTSEVTTDSLKFDLFGEESAMWVNYNPLTLKIKFGAILEPQGTTPGATVYRTISDIPFNIKPGYGTNPILMNGGIQLANLTDLADGTYKVTIATSPTEGDTETWTPVKPAYGYYNYVSLKKEGNQFTTDSNPIVVLDLLGCDVLNKLYFGGLAKIKIHVGNDSDLELTKGFAPAFIYEDKESGKSGLLFLGESIYLTVPPHTEVDKEWTTPLYALTQIGNITSPLELQLAFMDESTYMFYLPGENAEPVVLHPNPGAPQLQLIGSPKITNATAVNEQLPNGGTSIVYVVSDPTSMDIEATVRLTNGIFCYNAMAFLVKPDFEQGAGQVEILSMAGMPMFLESPGLRQKFKATLSYPLVEPNEYYAVMMGYQYGSNYVSLSAAPTYFRLDTSDVKELPSEGNETDGEIYNLQGISVGRDFDSLPAGLYIRNGKKILKK